MSLLLLKDDPFYTKKVVMLHNEWNLAEGRLLFCTRITSQGHDRRLLTPPAGQVPESYKGSTGATIYIHPYTSVSVDFGYGSYLFDFDPSRPNVEGHVFT